MVLNVLDTTYVTIPNSLDWKFRFYAQTFIPAAIKRAAAILTLSEHGEDDLRLEGVGGKPNAQEVHELLQEIGN